MDIIVTGSTGFLGQNLVEFLSGINECNVIPVAPATGFDFRTDDWCDNLPSADIVVHLAQSKKYKDFPASAEDIYAVNVSSTTKLLEWGRKQQIKSFIFASTGSVYKTDGSRSYKESDICDPQNYYEASKLCAEHLVSQYGPFFPVTILRIFSLYGPRQEGKMVPMIVNKIMNNESLALAQGVGHNFTPLYIDDAVKMIQLIISKGHQINLTSPQVLNIAGKEIISLREVAHIIARELGEKVTIEDINEEVRYLCGDISKFRDLFDFIPKFDFQSGIKETLASRLADN